MRLFHPDVQWDRVVKHVPHGLLLGLLCLNPLTWKLAAAFWGTFRAYEEDECRHVGDQAWHDYLGVVFGVVVIALIAVPVMAVVIARWLW